jgi:hypothetical protein
MYLIENISNILNNHTINDILSSRICSYQILMVFIMPAVSIIGILSNGLSSLIFYQIIRSKNKKFIFLYSFKCFQAKSICDLSLFIIHIFIPIYYNESFNSIMSIIWFIYFYNFGQSILLVGSNLFEIISMIEFYTIISNKKNKIKRFRFICIFIFVSIYSILSNILILFRYEIVYTSNGYKDRRSSFYEMIVDKYFRFIETFFRDILSLIIVVSINLLMIVKIKKASVKRQSLKLDSSVNLITKAHRKAFLMVFLISLIYLVGRIPLMIYYLPFEKVDITRWQCFYNFSLLPYYLSYTLNIFIYYFYNKHFRDYFKKLCKNFIFKRK